jgi:hypothetical protein
MPFVAWHYRNGHYVRSHYRRLPWRRATKDTPPLFAQAASSPATAMAGSRHTARQPQPTGR